MFLKRKRMIENIVNKMSLKISLGQPTMSILFCRNHYLNLYKPGNSQFVKYPIVSVLLELIKWP